MAVSETRHILFAGYGGEGVPFPWATWFVQVGILTAGDATGGEHILEVEFVESTQAARDSNIYSLEQLNCTTFGTGAANNGIIGQLQSQNLSYLPKSGQTGSIGQSWLIPTNGTDVLDRTVMSPRDIDPFRKIMLGKMGDVPAFTGLRLRTDNVNQRTIILTVMGYVWSSKAWGFPGGLQRPANGIWG